MDLAKNTQIVKRIAADLGFMSVGIAEARRLDEEAERLEQWLNKGYHGEMSYMENHFEKRVDPAKLVPGAKSVISLALNYYTEEKQADPNAPNISMYAYGRDYHKVLKKKLKQFLSLIREEIGDVQGRCFVDSAPILERDWAKYAGVGWIGKHTLLLHPRKGSYFFLAELVLDLPLESDVPMRDHCGTCTRCIDACPTDAISPEGYLLDASRCISYLTIELKGAIPETFKEQMEDWVFGCDICQQVCPWNRFSSAHQNEELKPNSALLEMKDHEWLDMTAEVFDAIFEGSAVKRTKYSGLRRNLTFLRH